MPGIYKIGKTTRDPYQRAAELFQTGVPEPFEVEHSVYVPDCDDLEYTMHQTYDGNRVSSDREFFTTALEDLIQTLDQWRLVQVNRLVDEFLPDHKVIEAEKSGIVGIVEKGAKQYALDPVIFAVASTNVRSGPFWDAVNWSQAEFAKLKAEEKRTKLRVVGGE